MLNAEYWFQPNPGPLTARAWIFYGVCLVIFIGCLIWSGWHFLLSKIYRQKTDIEPAKHTKFYVLLSNFELGVGLVGLLLVGARLALIPGWSARIWPLVMVGLALSGPLALYWSHRPANWFDDTLQLLAFRSVGRPLPVGRQLIFWTLHLVGWGVWVTALNWPLWWAVFLWSLFLIGQLAVAALLGRQEVNSAGPMANFYVSPLFPLFLAYAAAALYLLLGLSHSPFPIPTYPTFSELYLLPLYLNSVSGAAIGYMVLIELFLVTEKSLNSCSRVESKSTSNSIRIPRLTNEARLGLVIFLAAILGMVSLGWMALELFIHRTHGVTGSDPYGYVQVAVDLVSRGTPLHRFDLFTHIKNMQIPWAPVIALGYSLPINEAGDAASVWPLGMSILLAAGYGLGDELGLYLTGPLMALLATLGVGWLTWLMGNGPNSGPQPSERQADGAQNRNLSPGTNRKISNPSAFALIASAFGLFVWATSFEVIDRSLVPMADVTAALFTSLVWIALLKIQARRTSLPVSVMLYGLAAGVALGLAFAVRYTQLLVVASILVGVGCWRAAGKRQRTTLLLIVLGALVAALPDIFYRWQVFSTPLANPQSRELIHFAWANVIPSMVRTTRQLLHGREFGLLLPFLAAGILWHWQHDRLGFATVVVGALVVTAVQLPYEALLVRDLLPLFPLLAAWTGLGIAWLWQSVIKGWPRSKALPPRLVNALSVGAIFLFLFLPIVRVEPLIMRTWRPHRASFGYVTAQERAALAKLNTVTPKSAAIGAQLNGGAIALHSQRRPFYPAGWTRSEFECFLVRMATDKVPVFLLDDSGAIRPAIDWLAAAGYLHPVVRLEVPLAKDGGTGWLYRVSTTNLKAQLDCQETK